MSVRLAVMEDISGIASLVAEIDEVCVSPEFRSGGIGSLLVTHAERELAQRGLAQLQLQLGVDNVRARHFY